MKRIDLEGVLIDIHRSGLITQAEFTVRGTLITNFPLTPQMTVAGEMTIGVYNGKRQIRRTVKKLVARAFMPRGKPNQVLAHRNGDKTDNDVGNLEWVPRPKRNNPPNPKRARKISDVEVRQVRRYLSEGVSQRDIATAYGVHYSLISRIASGKRR